VTISEISRKTTYSQRGATPDNAVSLLVTSLLVKPYGLFHMLVISCLWRTFLLEKFYFV